MNARIIQVCICIKVKCAGSLSLLKVICESSLNIHNEGVNPPPPLAVFLYKWINTILKIQIIYNIHRTCSNKVHYETSHKQPYLKLVNKKKWQAQTAALMPL